MNEFEIGEIKAGLKFITHFMTDCTGEFSMDDWNELRNRHILLIEQFTFWVERDNTKRMVLDVREFVTWFCDKITDVHERNFEKGVDIDE